MGRRKKDWKEIEREFFDGLPGAEPDNKKAWVRKRVKLVCDGDIDRELLMYSRNELIEMFPLWVKVDGKKRLSLNDAAVLMTIVWQIRMMIKAKLYGLIGGNLRTAWYKHIEPFYIGKDLLSSDIAVPRGALSLLLPSVLADMEKAGIPGVSEGFEALRDMIEGARGIRDLRGPAAKVYKRVAKAARERYITNTMGEAFDAFVEQGIFRFQDDFGFLDPRESWRTIGKKRPRIIFFTEKEGLWWLCQHLSKKYDITVIASQGESSLLALEFLVDRLKKKKVKSVIIAALTDYDPWGFLIAGNFAQKLKLDINFGEDNVELVRLTRTQDDLGKFFTPEQIERGKRDLRLYTQYKQAQVKDWMDETQGINKEPYGIHIDLAERERVKAVLEAWVESV